MCNTQLRHVDTEHRDLVKAVTIACLLRGMESRKKGFCLWPTLMCHVESMNKTTQWAGRTQELLQDAALEAYFQILPGRFEAAVLPRLSALFPMPSAALSTFLARIQAVEQHPDTRYR